MNNPSVKTKTLTIRMTAVVRERLGILTAIRLQTVSSFVNDLICAELVENCDLIDKIKELVEGE